MLRDIRRGANSILAPTFAMTIKRLFVVLCFCHSFPLAADIALPQADGTTLILAAPATSIITLAPNLTELVYAAGSGEQLVATVEYSDYPQQASDLPRVGDAYRLDLERILSLKPDLVLAWKSGNPQAAVARLQSLGITTWTVEVSEPDEIADLLEQIGVASGNTSSSSLAANEVRHKLAELKQAFDGAEPVSYFYQVAAHPLFTINGQQLISRGLELCGGVNVFNQAQSLAPQVSHEAVIAANPQALLAPVLEGEGNALALWLEWPRMQAVANNALYLLPADEISRATPRMLDALRMACHFLNETRIRSTP